MHLPAHPPYFLKRIYGNASPSMSRMHVLVHLARCEKSFIGGLETYAVMTLPSFESILTLTRGVSESFVHRTESWIVGCCFYSFRPSRLKARLSLSHTVNSFLQLPHTVTPGTIVTPRTASSKPMRLRTFVDCFGQSTCLIRTCISCWRELVISKISRLIGNIPHFPQIRLSNPEMIVHSWDQTSRSSKTNLYPPLLHSCKVEALV